ncbi:MAG TPA: hypothetical protein ENI29_07655 [bacterium]|nr:hypothetical protein [bacterium]
MVSPSILFQDNTPKISQGAIKPDDLIPINFTIYIDGNWSAYVEKYDWATGKGIDKDPYVIEGIHVTNKEQTAYISIENTKYFVIRNVTVSNYVALYGHYTFAGIYIGNGQFGVINNVTIINATQGISLANGLNLADITDSIKITNSRFIGSHYADGTGKGAAISLHGVNFGYQFGDDFEFKTNITNIEISKNDIFSYASGILVSRGENISVKDNRIETIYGYVSDTGVYFKEVKDSEIIINDFYGCKSTTQDSIGISMSSFDDNTIVLENSINIKVFGNDFYDKNGNLIIDIPDEPDPIPDELSNPSIPINNSIFILVGGIIVGLVGISIFLKLSVLLEFFDITSLSILLNYFFIFFIILD